MKRFIVKTFIFFTPIFTPVLYYLSLSTKYECSGDIGSMAKIFFEKEYHTNLDIVPDSILIQDVDIQDIPDSSAILCFGDSFSTRRPYSYLQPIAEHLGTNIVNVLYNIDNAPEDAALGFLANEHNSKMPRIMIVESVERSSVARLFWLDTSHPFSIEQLQKGKKHSTNTPLQSIEKEIISFYKYRLGWNNGVVFEKLNKSCFTSKNNKKDLYSYYEDTVHYSKEFVDSAANKLHQLHQFAKTRKVKLIYVIASNKSTLYAPYTNNKDKYFTIENTPSFDTLPFYFNSINLLRQLDETGEKDIYYCDDTHWTPKTAKKIGEKLTEIIIEQFDNHITQ